MPEAKEEKSDRIKDTWIPFLSLIVAILGITSGLYSQHITNKSNYDIKKFEITYLEKRKAFSDLMAEFDTYLTTSLPDMNRAHLESGLKLEKIYFLLLPFIPSEKRENIENHYRNTIFLINSSSNKNTRENSLTPKEAHSIILKSVDTIKSKELLTTLLLEALFQGNL